MADKFYVDRKAHKMFKDLVDLSHSPFYKKDMKDVFIFAMAIGYRRNKRKELEKKKDIADVDVFKEPEKLLIKSIAVKTEGKVEVLMDDAKAIEVAEKFANGGIDTLYEWVFKSKEPPVKLLDKKITELVKKK